MKTKFTTIALALLLGCAGWANAATPRLQSSGFLYGQWRHHWRCRWRGGHPANLAELKKYAEDSITLISFSSTKRLTRALPAPSMPMAHCCQRHQHHLWRCHSPWFQQDAAWGSTAMFLNRVGLNVQCHSNIIVRNIKFTMTGVPIDKNGENKIIGFANGAEVMLGDPDCFLHSGRQGESG